MTALMLITLILAIPNQTVDDDYITAFKLDQVTYRYYRLEFAIKTQSK